MIRVMRSASAGQARISFMPPSGTERTLRYVRFGSGTDILRNMHRCPLYPRNRTLVESLGDVRYVPKADIPLDLVDAGEDSIFPRWDQSGRFEGGARHPRSFDLQLLDGVHATLRHRCSIGS
jgi:hypothetical protein